MDIPGTPNEIGMFASVLDADVVGAKPSARPALIAA
jgi:hypothetical protein